MIPTRAAKTSSKVIVTFDDSVSDKALQKACDTLRKSKASRCLAVFTLVFKGIDGGWVGTVEGEVSDS